MMVRRILLSLCIVLLYTVIGHTQDFHYSQFSNAPLQLNPALTGVFAGETRISASYRSQWNQVPVSYKTFTATADHKYTCGRSGPGFFASGIAVNYDQAGASRLSMAQVGLYGSYTYPLNDQAFFTGGLTFGLGQRAFDTDDLRFDRQFDVLVGQFNSNLGSNETFANQSHIFMDAGIGINFRWQELQSGALIDLLDQRSKLDLGIGVHHLNRPDMSFIEDEKVNLPVRWSPYASGTIQVGDPVDIQLAAMAQFQNTYRQYLGTAGIKLHINRDPGQQWSALLGVGYRFDEFGDAWYPALEIHYHEMLRASLSYDINISDFNIATNRRGGLELNVRYLIKKVCPLPNFKFCPLI
ncbi:MAG: PorP/SprF family type IX secretion system membrane protein [Lewinella sp.]|jgi:type IX secretion system PorP/SprF family membrane protein|uniref:PorP/SprF family type IX secretion system membrane protein n=1 Tax=Lewinella sp. TaxID=2004506 RepID=UPI003D6A96A8